MAARASANRPRWVIAGLAAVLAPALPAAAQAIKQTAGEIVVQAEGQHLSATCTGQAVRLEGNRNTLMLSGGCASLLVKGVSNEVQIALRPGASLRVEGSGNHVMTLGAAPAAPVLLGPDNTVSASAAPAPAPAPAPVLAPAAPAPAPVPVPVPSPAPAAAAPAPANIPLLLDGADQDRTAECAGRDVTVAGLRSAYALQGGCRSLTIRGDLISVRADLAPGARIQVTGRGNVISYTLHGAGRAPIAAVHGEGNRVQRADAGN